MARKGRDFMITQTGNHNRQPHQSLAIRLSNLPFAEWFSSLDNEISQHGLICLRFVGGLKRSVAVIGNITSASSRNMRAFDSLAAADEVSVEFSEFILTKVNVAVF
jgi:hypothetical protein